MALISKTFTFSTGATILAAEHNTNFDTLYNWANGNVDNANVKANAGINLSKLSLSDDATFTGDISLTSSATTDDVFTITANSLTTGSALKITSNSSDDSTRTLLQLINDNASATDALPLLIQQDGGIAHIRLTGDPSNSSPTDGDIWYDGTDFKGYNGSATVTFNSRIVQQVYTQHTTYTSTLNTELIPLDDTIPQSSEGKEIFTKAITPSSATNILRIDVSVQWSAGGTGTGVVALFQDSTANALTARAQYIASSGTMQEINFTYFMVAGTTDETTFKIRAGMEATDTMHINGTNSARIFGGVCVSGITITEIYV